MSANSISFANPTRQPRKNAAPDIDGNHYDRLKGEGKSRREMCRELQVSYGALTRWIERNRPLSNGEPESLPISAPATTLQKVEVIGEPVGEPQSTPQLSDLDSRVRALEGADLSARIGVLEAFFAAVQQQPALISGSLNGLPVVHQQPTRKRGFVIACDLSDAIDAYASANHMQVKDVLDLALRRFFAAEGGQ
jgi:hypothetical protein